MVSSTSSALINKFDLNFDMTKEIEYYCRDEDIQVIGKMWFDEDVVKAMVEGKTVLEYSNGKMKDRIEEIWDKLQSNLSKAAKPTMVRS